jgi:hypothetical protein
MELNKLLNSTSTANNELIGDTASDAAMTRRDVGESAPAPTTEEVAPAVPVPAVANTNPTQSSTSTAPTTTSSSNIATPPARIQAAQFREVLALVAPYTSRLHDDKKMITPPRDSSSPTEGNKTATFGTPGLLTPMPSPSPSPSASASHRAFAPLSFDNWTLRKKDIATTAHYKRAQIFKKTREIMFCKTSKMFGVASRGFERGHLPTRRTTPPLRKRRYSIDVNTVNHWERKWHAPIWSGDELARATIPTPQSYSPDDDLSAYSVPVFPFPESARYVDLGRDAAMYPPSNSDTYLELGNATLTNEAFLYIRATQWSQYGSETWMRDESIDMALEVISRDLKCDEHSIGITNSYTAQICFSACRDQDGSSSQYDHYRTQFRDKRWIFIVISDAIGVNAGGDFTGTHWSLVAMDRHHRTAHYYDSLYIRYNSYRQMGVSVSLGMLSILGEDSAGWEYLPEWNSPSQNWDNRCQSDGGACGPFVYKMTEMLVQRIQSFQRRNRETNCRLGLDPGFPAFFRTKFNSKHVRFDIQDSIIAWKLITDAPIYADRHDQDAIRDVIVALEDEPVVAVEPRRTVIEDSSDNSSDSSDSVMGEISDGSSDGKTENIEVDSDANWVSLESEANDAADQDMEEDGRIHLVNPDDDFYEDDDMSGAVTRLA